VDLFSESRDYLPLPLRFCTNVFLSYLRIFFFPFLRRAGCFPLVSILWIPIRIVLPVDLSGILSFAQSLAFHDPSSGVGGAAGRVQYSLSASQVSARYLDPPFRFFSQSLCPPFGLCVTSPPPEALPVVLNWLTRPRCAFNFPSRRETFFFPPVPGRGRPSPSPRFNTTHFSHQPLITLPFPPFFPKSPFALFDPLHKLFPFHAPMSPLEYPRSPPFSLSLPNICLIMFSLFLRVT